MNIDDYQNQYEPRYAAFAEAIKLILEEAIAGATGQGIPRPQAIQSRAKGAVSLKPKLEKRGILASDAIETLIKDLAGVRLIFYTDTDVDRFLNSRLIPESFEVEWKETKIHHPNPENDEQPYQAIHYVVRLTPDMLAKPDYAQFAGMRCEIQIQTMLSHIWAETSHNILYKAPELKGFGSEAIKAIEKRLLRVMRQYLVPAGHEFAKVQHDFERLMQGKALFDRGTLDMLAHSRDNNERHDTLSTIKEYVLPNYDDIEAIYPELARALSEAVRAARVTAPKPIPSELGDLPGATAQQITSLAVDILDMLRYVNVELTFRGLADIFRDETDGEMHKHILQAVEHLAKHNLPVWQKAGPYVQFVLAGLAEQLPAPDAAALRPLVRIVWRESLSSELRGTSFGPETLSFNTGAVVVSDELKVIRQKAIDGLFAAFDQSKSLAEKAGIFSDLMRATSVPTQGRVSNDLYALTISDTERIAGLLADRIAGQPYELLQRIEHRMLTLYRRAKQIASEAQDRFGCKAAAASLLRVIEALRDRMNADSAFFRYKTLVGFESVFPPHWDDDNFDFNGAEAYRRQRMSNYIAAISTENADEWHDLIVRCAATESNDAATFPIFCDFLRELAKAKPAIALRYLARADEHLLTFLPAILNGLSGSGATADYEALVARYLDEGRHFAAIVRHFRYLAVPPLEQAKTLLAKALANHDGDTVKECVALSVEKLPSTPDVIEAIFVPAIRYLAATEDFRWIRRVWFMPSLEAFAALLSPGQIRLALKSLLSAPKIDHEIERFLTLVAARDLAAVWKFLGQRLSGGQGIDDYEAIPYQFHGLERQLSSNADLAIETVRGWYRPDDHLFQFNGGRLLCAALPTFSDAVSRKYSNLAATGTDQDIAFILDVLPNYRGDAAILPVLMEVANRLPSGDPRLDKAELCIETTGVVSGAFGFVEAHRAKKAALPPWLNDGRPRVKAFAAECIRRLDLRIASEQRSAEQRREQRRLDFEGEDNSGGD